MAKSNAKAVEALVGVDQSATLDRDPISLKDGAYQQAKAGDRIRSVAKYVMANAVASLKPLLMKLKSN